MLDTFKTILSRNFEVTAANNGQEAIEAVESHPRSFFRAIFLDLDMPLINGIEACTRIKTYLQEEEKQVFVRDPYQINYQG